jgi:hypothetical protein
MANAPNPEDLLHASVRPGDVLAGKYAVERIIGSGGMGVVIVAVHVDLYERVAPRPLRRPTRSEAAAPVGENRWTRMCAWSLNLNER